jgi:hypothetical protein
MHELEHDLQFNEAVKTRGLIEAAAAEAVPDLLRSASNITLVLRHTAIQEHLRGCQNHVACGWLDTSEPFNVRNDESWSSPEKLQLIAATQRGIADGSIVPWLPAAPPANPNPEDYPLFRAR